LFFFFFRCNVEGTTGAADGDGTRRRRETTRRDKPPGV
jgi:hypothetical protein